MGSDCPAFQRLHSSVRCAAESATIFLGSYTPPFEQKFYIRWCCIDPLRPPELPGVSLPLLGPIVGGKAIRKSGRQFFARVAPSCQKLPEPCETHEFLQALKKMH